jgi:hypothetical protein
LYTHIFEECDPLSNFHIKIWQLSFPFLVSDVENNENMEKHDNMVYAHSRAMFYFIYTHIFEVCNSSEAISTLKFDSFLFRFRFQVWKTWKIMISLSAWVEEQCFCADTYIFKVADSSEAICTSKYYHFSQFQVSDVVNIENLEKHDILVCMHSRATFFLLFHTYIFKVGDFNEAISA